jgi:hypothetical protein
MRIVELSMPARHHGIRLRIVTRPPARRRARPMVFMSPVRRMFPLRLFLTHISHVKSYGKDLVLA